MLIAIKYRISGTVRLLESFDFFSCYSSQYSAAKVNNNY